MLKVVFQTLFNFIMCIVGGQTYTDSESQKVDRAEEDLKNSITMKQKSSVEINQNEEETLLEEDSEEDCSVVDWRAVDEVASEEIIQNEETQLKTNIEYPSMSIVRILLERKKTIYEYRIVQMHKNDWENFAINDLNIPEELIRKLKSKFGRTQTKMKLKMLLLWRNKHKQQGLAKEEFIQCAEDFIDKELNIDMANHSFTDVCRLIVTAIPNEKFMRFARLELALAEKEISNLRAKYSEFTEEQKYQMLRWFLRGNEAKTYPDSESQKVDRAGEFLKIGNSMKQKGSVEINQNEEETLLEEESEEDCPVVDWRAVDEVEIIYKYRIAQMHKNDWENFAINDLNIPEKLIRKLKSKFGRTQTKMKLKMLLLWRNKHKQQGLAKEELIQCAEDFIDKELYIDMANHSFTDVCRLIVTAIPNEKWMRFARLELALAEKEISNLRAKYSEFTEEQKYQMLRWFLRGNEGFSGDTGEDIIGRDYQIIPISSI